MNKRMIPIGTVVMSCAGKDCGSLYVVICHADDLHAEIADGRRYKVEKSKKKNFRHLRIIGTSVSAADAGSVRISNEWIRSVLNRARMEETREVTHV